MSRVVRTVVVVAVSLLVTACGEGSDNSGGGPDKTSAASPTPTTSAAAPGDSDSAGAVTDVSECARWITTESDGYTHRFTFRDDGYIDYQTRSPGDDSFRSYDGSADDSRWTQDGQSLDMEMNGGSSTYEAQIVGDEIVDGTGTSASDGTTWSWSAECEG